ncbi:hypothetical protein AB205_0112800, partial [Aquarana catesbeiana]
KVELPPVDLGPSSALNQTLTLLREVLVSHDSSVVPLDARQADFVQIEAHLDTLINEQASFVLTRAGLSQIYNCVQQHKPEQPAFV